MLDVIGYSSAMTTAEGTPHEIQLGITLIFFIGTVLLIGSALLLSNKIVLNKETHAILKAEIERLEAGGSKKDVSPEAKEICEELTGHDYDTL